MDLGYSPKFVTAKGNPATRQAFMCCITGIAVSSIVGFGTYYSLRALDARENLAKVCAWLMAAGPICCTSCIGCCTCSAAYHERTQSAAVQQVVKAAESWFDGESPSGFGEPLKESCDRIEASLRDNPLNQMGFGGQQAVFNQARAMAQHLTDWGSAIADLDDDQAENVRVARRVLVEMTAHAQEFLYQATNIMSSEISANVLGMSREGARKDTNFKEQHRAAVNHKVSFLALEQFLESGDVPPRGKIADASIFATFDKPIGEPCLDKLPLL